MLEVLREDFLDRDRDSFVKIRRTGRLGWESLIPSGGSYSDLLRDCRGEDDVIKEAYGLARDCIVALPRMQLYIEYAADIYAIYLKIPFAYLRSTRSSVWPCMKAVISSGRISARWRRNRTGSSGT